MKFAVRKVVALFLAILMFVPSVASFAEGTVDYSDTVSTYTLDPESLSVEEAIQEVYDEYIAELQAMATYEERYTWLNNAKNNPASELGDYFYADFIAYYNENNPEGDLICVCAEPIPYGVDGHTEGCRWSAESAAADDAIIAVYDEYIAELKAMTSYADRYAWLYSAKNEPDSELGDYFYADFIAYYNEKEPTGDAMCVCAEPLVYGADGHTEGCRWNFNNLVTVPGASASSGSASVSGELPAGATLSVTSSASAPAAFTGLFETDKGAYTDTQYNSYDLKIMVGDQQWQPGSKVAVTLSNVWSGEGTPAVYVYHFIDIASAIDSDCIISYDSALVSAYSEAAAAAALAGYANAVAYEVFSTVDGTATYKAETNSVTFSLDSFSDVVTGASAEAYSDILVEGYEAELAYISNTANCPTMQDVYAYLATDKAAGEGGIEAYYNDFYSGFAAWYKTTYPTGTMLCTCTTCVYDENNVMTDCPPYAYNTIVHEETCPWHSNNVGQTSTTISAGEATVSGVLPAGAYLEQTSADVPEDFAEYFELEGIDFDTISVKGYDVKLMMKETVSNEDGTTSFVANKIQPDGTLTMTLSNAYDTSLENPVVYVYHILDSKEAIESTEAFYIQTTADPTLTAAYGDAVKAAAEAGLGSVVAYTVVSSFHNEVSLNDGSVTFKVDSFSDFVVESGSSTDFGTLTAGEHTLTMLEGTTAYFTVNGSNRSSSITNNTNITQSISGSTLTISAANASAGDTATVTVTWNDSYFPFTKNTATILVTVIVPTVPEKPVELKRSEVETQTVTGTAATTPVVKNANGDTVTGITVAISGTTATVTASADVALGTYTATWTDSDDTEHTMAITVLPDNHEGSVTVEQGKTATKDMASEDQPDGPVTIVDANNNKVDSSLISITNNYGYVTVTTTLDTEIGTYTASWADSEDNEHVLTINVVDVEITPPSLNDSSLLDGGEVDIYVGQSITHTIADAEDYVYFVYDANGKPATDAVTAIPSETTLNTVNIATSRSATVADAAYTIVYVKKDSSVAYKLTVNVISQSNNDGYKLNQANYGGSDKVYWDEMASKGDSVWNNEGEEIHISEIYLAGTEVTWSNAEGTSWDSDAEPLSTYYGTSLNSNSVPETRELRIVPVEGYYVTTVVVACAGSNQKPYNCNTWSDNNAFIRTFSVGDYGSVSIDLPSNAFGHSNNSASAYFILVMTAPIPTPLHVEYNYGNISDFLSTAEIADSVFSSPDAWTDDSTSNVYRPSTNSDGGILTNDTQFKYTYVKNSENATSWVHVSNTVTSAAKQAAANEGYYFAGWEAKYYTKVTESETNDEYGNDYTLTFSTEYGTKTYGENVNVDLTTNVKLTAIWKPIELTLTKSISGLENYDGTLDTYTFKLQKWNGTEWVNQDTLTLTLTPTTKATKTYTLGTFTPSTAYSIGAGKYRLVETGYNLVLEDETDAYYVAVTDGGEAEFTIDGIIDGTTRSAIINVDNTYSTTPIPANLVIDKTVSGNAGDQSKEFSFTVTYRAPGTTTDVPVTFTLKHGDKKVISIPVGSLVTSIETSDGYSVTIEAEGATPSIDTSKGEARIDKLGRYGAKLHYTNTKNITVETGILLDSAPYVLLLALVGAGIAFMIIRRRRRED